MLKPAFVGIVNPICDFVICVRISLIGEFLVWKNRPTTLMHKTSVSEIQA